MRNCFYIETEQSRAEMANQASTRLIARAIPQLQYKSGRLQLKGEGKPANTGFESRTVEHPRLAKC